MDIYITEKSGGTRVALSMLPEKIKLKGSGKFQSYDIIGLGEVRIPRGTKLLSFGWSGTFPGASRRRYGFVKSHHWESPKELVKTFEQWRKRGSALILMATETPINHEVMLSEFTATPSGGYGDIQYDVTFIEHREISICTTSELNIKPVSKSIEASTDTRPAPAAASAKTYTVQNGDCLWNIAKKHLGSGSRYIEIYNLNKGLIGSDPNRCITGWVLTMP